MSSQDVWQSILEQVRPHVNIQSFNTWMTPTRLDHNGDSQLSVIVPNREYQEWIQENFHRQILEVAAGFGIKEVIYIPEHAEPAPKPAPELAIGTPQPKTARQECPVVPEAAWYGMAKEYRNLVHPTTAASDNFHLAGFLVAAGAGLGKTVYVRGGGRDITYPNMFAALVGRSSRSHKGTSINLALALARESHPTIGYTRSIDSAQGLIKDLEKQKMRQASAVIACLPEMKDLIEKGNSKGLGSLLPKICELYDSPPKIEVNTKNNSISVDDPPMFSVLAGCAPRWLEKLREEDIESGIGNRVMFVAGEPRSFIAEPPAIDAARWSSLVAKLAGCFKYWHGRGSTEFHFSDEAKRLWFKFCGSFDRPRSGDALIDCMNDRGYLHAGKTALIHAALDRTDDEIQVQHLRAALTYSDFLFNSLLYIFRGFGASPWVKEEHKIMDIIRQEGKVPRRNLYRRFFQRTMSMEFFEKHLRFISGEVGDENRPIWILRQGLQQRQILVANPEWPWQEDEPEA